MSDQRFPGPRHHVTMNGRVSWNCVPLHSKTASPAAHICAVTLSDGTMVQLQDAADLVEQHINEAASPAALDVNSVEDILADAESDGIIGPDYTPRKLAQYIVDSLRDEEVST